MLKLGVRMGRGCLMGRAGSWFVGGRFRICLCSFGMMRNSRGIGARISRASKVPYERCFSRLKHGGFADSCPSAGVWTHGDLIRIDPKTKGIYVLGRR